MTKQTVIDTHAVGFNSLRNNKASENISNSGVQLQTNLLQFGYRTQTTSNDK